MAVSEDTEITLGTGKMLLLFFGLVALCAVFFGMGYSLGKNSARPNGDPLAANGVSSVRPTAVKANEPRPPSDLTFYKAVEQKDPNTELASQSRRMRRRAPLPRLLRPTTMPLRTPRR